MVYKTEKYGVRTGNSFRRFKAITRHLRRYRRQSCLVRSHIAGDLDSDLVQFQKTNAFGEGDSIRDGVQYSLNKQRRWDLPQILENVLLHEGKTEDYDVQLIQRHVLRRMANCVSVVTTGGIYRGGKLSEDRKFTSKKSGGYFQSNSVLSRKLANSKRDRRRQRRLNAQDNPDENNEETPKEKNTIRYDVLYPVPANSYVTRDARMIGIDTDDIFRWTGYQDKQKSKTRREKLRYCIRESLSCMEDALDDSEEESSVPEIDDIKVRCEKLDVTLQDILQHANSAKKLTAGKKRRSSGGSLSSVGSNNGSEKNHIVYIEGPEKETSESAASTSTKLHRTVVEPVRVILKNDAISPLALTRRFGTKYIECECFPRKCIINISDHVSKLKLSSLPNIDHLQTEACVILVHDTDNEINSMIEGVYKVYLNANFGESLNCVRIETVFDYMETNVDEILERTLFFIETLPFDSLVCDAVPLISKRRIQNTVEECANWFSGSYHPTNSYLLEHFIARTPAVEEAISMGYEFISPFDTSTTDDSENVASQKDRFCCICYSELGENNPGTALISCSHWFCNLCWKKYLETKTSSGTSDFLCPEFDCNKVLDPGTVLSLVNMRDVIRHAKRCHDTEVEQQTTTRWCPNEKCGRVIQRSSKDVKTLGCVCGLEVCFDCLEAPHWPANCESSKSYYKKMRETGDIAIEPVDVRKPVVVRGKPCPKCNRFIEKNGGCPSMTCVCKAHFCWGCGQLWDSRNHGTDCYKYGYKDTHNTTERTFAVDNPLEKKNRKRWYKMALKHRINRHPGRLSRMRTYAKDMSKRMQKCITRLENSGEAISLDFDSQTMSYKREADKTMAYLANTLNLYAEINYVVENTAVLLNSEERPAKSQSVLKYIFHRLSGFSDIIYHLFVDSDAIETKLLIQRLKDARFHSRKTIQSLIRSIQSINAGC